VFFEQKIQFDDGKIGSPLSPEECARMVRNDISIIRIHAHEMRLIGVTTRYRNTGNISI
jgi:hypothetical protein